MSYQVLARKWRPATFAEMVGQEHVLRALANALDHDRLHHAYLFTGTRGVGKTTVARILAKCLNCEQGVSSQPCGNCSACREIAEGRSVDLLEVDAASRTKVDDTRELLENVQYAPTRNRFKIYLIDEVHMLSSHSFNALLKTLEEPPPHVKFLLATTDPQKLPATVLSRCLQFNLKNMPAAQVVGHLQTVLDAEMVSYEEPALWLLGRAAAGSMRDALSLTDQAIAFGSGQLIEADVRSMLGTVDRSFIYQLMEPLLADDAPGVLAVVAHMAEQAADFENSVDELISVLHRLAVAQVAPAALGDELGDAAQARDLAARMSAEDVQLYYQIAINGKRDMAVHADTQSAFEMIMLRMLAFRPVAAVELIGEVQAPAPGTPAPQPTAGADSSSSGTRARPVPPTESRQSAGAPEPQPAGEVGERAKKPEAPPRGAASGNWAELLERLRLTGSTYMIASNCEWRSDTGEHVELVLDPEQVNLFNARHIERIRTALEQQLGRSGLALTIEPGPLLAETPAQAAARAAREAHEAAVARMRADPALSSVIERFAGTLDEKEIGPAGGS